MPSLSRQLTADIVSAYVGSNHLPVEMLGTVIKEVHAALVALERPKLREQASPPKKSQAKPRIDIAGLVTDDYVVSLENGKRYRTLANHLRALGLTPTQYRAKWGLPYDHPLTALGFSKEGSAVAKRMGLGRRNKG